MQWSPSGHQQVRKVRQVRATLVLLGHSDVGKTSLEQQRVEGYFLYDPRATRGRILSIRGVCGFIYVSLGDTAGLTEMTVLFTLFFIFVFVFCWYCCCLVYTAVYWFLLNDFPLGL